MHIQKNGHENDMAKVGGFLMGLAIGGMAGAGTALLLAPESGDKTRTELQQKGVELRNQTKDMVETTMADVRGKARQIADPVRKNAKELERRGQQYMEEQGDRVANRLS
jgi:gas vesicle protein